MSAEDLFQPLVATASPGEQVDFLRSVLFDLFRESLASGAMPRQTSVPMTDGEGAAHSFTIQVSVDDPGAFPDMIKRLFAANAESRVRALPCRIEEMTSSTQGLALLLDDVAVVTLGPAADGASLMLRQLTRSNARVVDAAASGNARRSASQRPASGRSAVVLDLSQFR